ncbi:hypothetical protein N9Z12_06055 [Opitutaceae bacterium]|nr:hypothetical protein [Opitutaceae bacterium]
MLIKVIAKPAPSREDVTSVIELTASKVVDALAAQSMTLYLVEGNDITFRHVYYSPTLWASTPEKEAQFKETEEKLLELKLPLGTGNVGKVIESGEPLFFTADGPDGESEHGIRRAVDADRPVERRFQQHRCHSGAQQRASRWNERSIHRK